MKQGLNGSSVASREVRKQVRFIKVIIQVSPFSRLSLVGKAKQLLSMFDVFCNKLDLVNFKHTVFWYKSLPLIPNIFLFYMNNSSTNNSIDGTLIVVIFAYLLMFSDIFPLFFNKQFGCQL